tara:strand:- start:372 stop:518 length:147 start_codon:yes stop_codon:yes gene_type:complete
VNETKGFIKGFASGVERAGFMGRIVGIRNDGVIAIIFVARNNDGSTFV